MEIQFGQQSVHCLQTLLSQHQQREEVQEIRLPEGMPDIGRILGCWGQVILRGKEWHSGGMNINGGVMAWVMYLPEDGSAPRSVEAWIPFQQKWEFDDGGRDGFIWGIPTLKSMDARSISARKIMLRANVSTLGKALQSKDHTVYSPEMLPEDVQLLRQTYPMDLPVEFGEKLLQIDEELTLPPSAPQIDQILRYELIPCVTEEKLMASRLVLRGIGKLRMMYLSGDKIHTWDQEIPWAQYADLDEEHSSGAIVKTAPIMTDLEAENVDGKLRIKAGIAVQFLICDRTMVEIIGDAYSPVRLVQTQSTELRLPVCLDHWEQDVPVSGSVRGEIGEVLDVCTLVDHPQRRQSAEGMQLNLCGSFQVLYYDPAGELQSANARFEMPVDIDAAGSSLVEGVVMGFEKPEIVSEGEERTIRQDLQLSVAVNGNEGVEMLTGLELGEEQEPDAHRPSIILRRYTDDTLWDMAKESGSTVEAIRKANGLEGEPQIGRLLLIPVS